MVKKVYPDFITIGQETGGELRTLDRSLQGTRGGF